MGSMLKLLLFSLVFSSMLFFCNKAEAQGSFSGRFDISGDSEVPVEQVQERPRRARRIDDPGRGLRRGGWSMFFAAQGSILINSFFVAPLRPSIYWNWPFYIPLVGGFIAGGRALYFQGQDPAFFAAGIGGIVLSITQITGFTLAIIGHLRGQRGAPANGYPSLVPKERNLIIINVVLAITSTVPAAIGQILLGEGYDDASKPFFAWSVTQALAATLMIPFVVRAQRRIRQERNRSVAMFPLISSTDRGGVVLGLNGAF